MMDLYQTFTPGAVLALARWGQWGPQFQLGAQYAAELMMLLVYLLFK